MAQIKSPPPPNAGIRELTEYIAYLQKVLQYEVDLRDKQYNELKSSIE